MPCGICTRRPASGFMSVKKIRMSVLRHSARRWVSEALAAMSDSARRKNVLENNVALIAAIDAITCPEDRTIPNCWQPWKANGIVHSPVNSYADVVKDEQAWQNNYFMKAYCEEVKREVEIRGLPVTLSKTPGEVNTLGPQLGQDTELLMMDLLEYEWDQIEEFKAKGAIP